MLSPEQCAILELFEQKQATFRIHMLAVWTAAEDSDDGYVLRELKLVPEIQMATQKGKREVTRGLSGNRTVLSSSSVDDDGPIDVTNGMPSMDDSESE